MKKKYKKREEEEEKRGSNGERKRPGFGRSVMSQIERTGREGKASTETPPR